MRCVLENDGEQYCMSSEPTYKPLEIEVTDFGPIAKAKIDLRPLTVFVGPSNTGKSYLATLIYALHRFFGGFAPNPGFTERVGPSLFDRFVGVWEDDQESSAVEIKALLAWMNRLFNSTQEKPLAEDFRARVPDDVAPLIRPFLREVSTLNDSLNDEIARCFGSEGTSRLIRHGSRDGAQVSLRRFVSETSLPTEPFDYTFTMQGGETALAASVPDTTPLQIGNGDTSPWHRERIQQWILRTSKSIEYQRFAEQYEGHAARMADPQQSELVNRAAEDTWRMVREQAKSLRNELVCVAGSSIISPLDRVAYYLPADRAGLIDTRSLIVASLIRRSFHTGLERNEALPALSGVLADFLEKLVVFEDSSQRERRDGTYLAKMLEIEVLRGEVREVRSETGASTFLYQPEGRKEEIPLKLASSMVSELAPVVLYLRQVVRPGDVLIIEEPEAHLHPGMQAAFTRQLAAIVRSGVRVMLTTHSDYVLEELANLVRMSELPESQQAGLEGAEFALEPEEVGVWLFEPKRRPKGTVVKEIKLDTNSGSFPAGYGDVTEALYNEWVEIESRIVENKPNP